MKKLSYLLIGLLFIGLSQVSVTEAASAHEDVDLSKVVQIDNGSNHIYISNSTDEHIVRVDAGNDNHICVIHDQTGKIVEVVNRSSHILINSHPNGAENNDCNSSTTPSTIQSTPTPAPTFTPAPTTSPSVTPTPAPTSQPTNNPTPTVVTASVSGPADESNILADSTMAPTGNSAMNIAHILEILGLLIFACGAYSAIKTVKSRQLFIK